jgi:protease-4
MLNLFLFVITLFGSAVSESMGAPGMVDMQTIEAYVAGPQGATQKIAVVPLEGVIGPSEAGLLGGGGEDMVSRVQRYLRRAAQDDSVVGVVLHIDSPGGAVTDSHELYEMIEQFREEAKKPVAAYFHAVAASGGYYAGMAAQRIFMHETGLTGSIGVILGTWNYSEAADKIGVQRVTVLSKNTPYKDILSGDRPMREDEQQILQTLVEEMYQRFVDVVDAGRPDLTRERVIELADGRIYSAEQAAKAGLVDETGTLRDAAAWVERSAGVEGARIVRYEPRPGLFDSLLGARGSVEGRIAARIGLLDPSPKMLYLWTGGF